MGSYRERLLVPVSYWLLAVPVVVTLGAEAYFFVDGFIPPLVIGALYAVVAVVPRALELGDDRGDRRACCGRGRTRSR